MNDSRIQDFWERINKFFKSAEEQRLAENQVFQSIERAANNVEFSPLMIKHSISFVDNEEEWEQVKKFLNHPENEGNIRHIVSQLKLVSQGVRDVRLSDSCVVLPLY